MKYKRISIEKVKPLLLKEAYLKQVTYGTKRHPFDGFDDCKKIRPYEAYNPNIVDKAVRELENDNKVIINNEDSPISFSLTDSTFNYLSENRFSLKAWFKSNIFKILNLILGIWGAITGTLALFLK